MSAATRFGTGRRWLFVVGLMAAATALITACGDSDQPATTTAKTGPSASASAQGGALTSALKVC
jgi:hypothetical protein